MSTGRLAEYKRRLAGVLGFTILAGALAAFSGPSIPASSAEQVMLPEIRTSPMNRVPQCVTPERLMAFLQTRNRSLEQRFMRIAEAYRYHGEAWRVRWDYAFFQMVVETNYLTYRQPNGRMGDVDPRQNNFAGIGTTGGGVPGDRFPDVSTGVLGQIQHLVAYSGEYVAQPVAERTRLKQVDILKKSHELMRPVRFSDLARRWAADPRYASTIEWVARSYREAYCAGGRQLWGTPDPVQPRADGPMVPPPPAALSPPQPMQRPQQMQRPAELLPWHAPQQQPSPSQGQPVLRPQMGLLTTGSIDRPPVIVTTIWRRGEQTPSATAVVPDVQPEAQANSGEAAPQKPAEPESSGFALFKAPEWLATVKPEAPLPPPAALGMGQGQ